MEVQLQCQIGMVQCESSCKPPMPCMCVPTFEQRPAAGNEVCPGLARMPYQGTKAAAYVQESACQFSQIGQDSSKSLCQQIASPFCHLMSLCSIDTSSRIYHHPSKKRRTSTCMSPNNAQTCPSERHQVKVSKRQFLHDSFKAEDLKRQFPNERSKAKVPK